MYEFHLFYTSDIQSPLNVLEQQDQFLDETSQSLGDQKYRNI